MLRSMTGFGQAERTFAGYHVQIEIRSVNHRYCEILIRQPKEWTRYEDMLRKTAQQYIKRGHVEISIQSERCSESELQMQINWPLLQSYVHAAQQIRNHFHLDDSMNLRDLLFSPDVLQFQQQDTESAEEIGHQLQQVLLDALTHFMRMREAEGKNLHAVMSRHLGQVEAYQTEATRMSPGIVAEYKQKLETRLREMMKQEYPVDEARLAMEVALFADKSNIDEELARLRSHIQQFRLLMSDVEPAGRRMDFLIQEMNREVNTIGSKANDAQLTNYVVAMKAELEKLREQVQNIE